MEKITADYEIMEHVYVCKKCGYTLIAEEGENRFCKNDGNKLTDSNVTKKEWDTYSDEIHQEVIRQVKETGKGVDPESLKPKTVPAPKPEPVPDTVNTEEVRKKPADYNIEQTEKLNSLKITEGSDGSSVVHTGNVVMTILIILSLINALFVFFFVCEIEDLLGVTDESGQITIGIVVIVTAIGILISVAVGKIIQGIGLSARNTYETKMMLKEALENQDYIIVKNSDQKESSEAENQNQPDTEKKVN